MAAVYSVSQVNSYIRNLFAQDCALSRISVRGEVSNCKYHTSGHIYFTLKDGTGTLSAVMFSSQRRGLSFRLQEGQRVVATGSVDVYVRDGRYQLYAQKIVPDGRGDLYERFCRLRDELAEMGMFAPEYKKPVPAYARTVGVVTAETGAAIRDIMNIAARRNPCVQLVLCPALVQGDGAAASIARGIRRLDELGLDVIIVGRGGGSIEDLWAFNEEEVARAIFTCRTPVISAVGHETDVTIADYVADLRAPTPSAAAELAVFDLAQYEKRLASYRETLYREAQRGLERAKNGARQRLLRLRLYDPARKVYEQRQRLALAQEKLETSLDGRLQGDLRRLEALTARLEAAAERRVTADRHRLALTIRTLDGLSPLKKLAGGYAFLADGDGRRITAARQVKPGQRFSAALADGYIRALVTGTEEVKMGSREAPRQDETESGRLKTERKKEADADGDGAED